MSTPTAVSRMLPTASTAQPGPPRVLSCSQCATRIAHTSGILSTAFRGHAGSAALLRETRNITLDPPSILLMDSGAYTIQEFICKTCEAYLGWKFVRAHDGPERWKEGHFVLELDLVQQENGAEAAESVLRDGQSPVQSRAAQEASMAAGLHKRTVSVDPRPPKGVKQGFRSLQAQMQRTMGAGDYDDGPFWKPR